MRVARSISGGLHETASGFGFSSLRGLCGDEMPSLEDVVSEGVPQHDRPDLCGTADIDPDQVPVAPASVDAFTFRTLPVDRLTIGARHPLTPFQNARPVVAARPKGVGAVFGLRRWTINLDLFAMCPFDIVRGGEAAVDEMPARQPTQSLANCLDRWPHQATIGTTGGGAHG